MTPDLMGFLEAMAGLLVALVLAPGLICAVGGACWWLLRRER